MTWILDEQQRLLRDSTRTFLEERMPVAHLRKLRDSNDALGYDPAMWAAFGQQGYSGLLLPEDAGGLGLGFAEAGIIAEELGRTLAPSPYLSTAILAAYILRHADDPGLRSDWLTRLASAEAVLALAVDEHGRHRPDRIATRARKTERGWTISGRKSFVVNGHGADAWIVAASSEDGVILALLPRGTPGVTAHRIPMVDSHNAATLELHDAPVRALLADPRDASGLLERVLDAGRAMVACELLGVADEVFQRTLAYLKERKQFGRPIGEFQALQHRMASLFCDLELTRAIIRQALRALDQAAADAPLRVAQAKARACLTANRAVQEGVQMHGGMGMTDELDVGLFMKRARVLQELFGDAAFHTDRAARLSGY